MYTQDRWKDEQLRLNHATLLRLPSDPRQNHSPRLSPPQPPALRFPDNHNYYNLFIPGLFRTAIDMEDCPARKAYVAEIFW